LHTRVKARRAQGAFRQTACGFGAAEKGGYAPALEREKTSAAQPTSVPTELDFATTVT